jgi:hypothetical protein
VRDVKKNVHTLIEFLPSISGTLWTLFVTIQDHSLFDVAKRGGRRKRMVLIPTFSSLSQVTTFTGDALNTAHGFQYRTRYTGKAKSGTHASATWGAGAL